ncbi:hypothetical protein [Agrobacterium tumefaciens]|uniref:Uncharacterized protein n=1 Tax=Agrobacterium tumefaciens TaxID=358 RepID=A0A4D7YYJ2_AGRTU|nr:hypothetical protein [Agrobacterium tumefaciens]QCL96084.1 hypothetical protein CFBP7129_17630 [Agrobacterium tumefaciens]
MAISAHLIKKGKFNATVTLSDDPSEPELIKALNGNKNDTAAYEYGRVGPWEVLYVPSQPDLKLVIGAAPFISDSVKKRTNCTLTSDQAEKLVKGVEWMLEMFGVNEAEFGKG